MQKRKPKCEWEFSIVLRKLIFSYFKPVYEHNFGMFIFLAITHFKRVLNSCLNIIKLLKVVYNIFMRIFKKKCNFSKISNKFLRRECKFAKLWQNFQNERKYHKVGEDIFKTKSILNNRWQIFKTFWSNKTWTTPQSLSCKACVQGFHITFYQYPFMKG